MSRRVRANRSATEHGEAAPPSESSGRSSDANAAESADGTEHSAPTGMGRVAKRWGNWAANLLVSGLIIVVALTFGRQVKEWWDAESPGDGTGHAAAVLGESAIGDELQPHQLEFGDVPFALQRSQFAGDQAAVFQALRDKCRAALQQSTSANHQPGPVEAKMLARIAAVEPVETVANGSIYQLEGPILLVVAVRQVPADNSQPHRREVVASRSGVVSWGLGVPTADSAWTLFTYSAADRSEGTTSNLALDALPDSCRRTMSLQAEDGGSLVGFRVDGPPQALMDEFDRRLTQRGWTSDVPWRRIGSGWHARFMQNRNRLDVQFAAADRQTMSGMLTLVVSSSDESSNKRSK